MIHTPNTIAALIQLVVNPIARTTDKFEKGAENIRGAKAIPRSIMKISAETKVTNLPEFVEVTDFIERLPTLS